MKQFLILLAAALIVALPFFFRRVPVSGDKGAGCLELVIITPHNEAFRQEFAEGFSEWHRKRFGRPVRIDWRVIGGTTEIMRYLTSEYEASAKHYSGTQPGDIPWHESQRIGHVDDPAKITCRIDLFFGGGAYDHAKAEKQGLTVPAWGAGGVPAGLFEDSAGRELIPRELNGEVWRGNAFYGCVLSAFGICYNPDRLTDLGITRPPAAWDDLADPRYFGHLGLADPTKSGSVAKAFEMIIQTQCAKAVAAAGYTHEQIRLYETRIGASGKAPGRRPPDVPQAYQDAISREIGRAHV